MLKRLIVAILLLLGSVISGVIKAEVSAIKDPLLKADFASESSTGATNAVAALSNGRLVVGISPWAEVVYFRWPCPSYYDHLRYITKAYGLLSALFPKDMRFGVDAPSKDWARYGRPYEKYPGLGARAGIYFADQSLNWIGDESWTSKRAYEPEDSSVLCTYLNSSKADLKVCQWVDWDSDLLVQDFQITSSSAQVFYYYATFDPKMDFDPGWGEPDSKKAGFASIYLEDSGVILYFYPQFRDKKKLLLHLNERLSAQKIDELYPEGGIFIALGFDEKPDQFQIGADTRGRRASKSAPLSASKDAQDGKLSSSRYYIGFVDAGLGKEIRHKKSKVVVFISVSDSAQKAVEIIQRARIIGADALRERNIRHWQGISQRIFLPAQADPIEKRVARRSILNLFVGRDRNSGAIVASPSRQPAYHFDWPRDGAFFDLALDLAGFSEITTSHLEFYRRTQRKENWDWSIVWLLGFKPLIYSPRGHWYSNINTDGTPGKLKIIPVEIDETALLLWDLWRHEQFLPEYEQKQYEERFKEMLVLSADALVKYVNEKKGWTKRVMEDDNPVPRATLHGASATLAGLASAIDAGKRWGVDKEKVERWRKSAISLRKGILRRITEKKTLEKGGWRGLQWTLFPAPVFETYDDERAQPLIKKLAEEIEQKISAQRPGFAYLGEQLFIFELVTFKMPEYRPLCKRALDVLIKKAPVPGTDCYGEVVIWIKLPDEKEPIAQNRTSIPHLWTGVCSYLSVLAYYQPELFLSQIPPVPR